MKGTRIYVRPNLETALRHLRDSQEVVVLWVDALCINQSDEDGEKPAQIAKMPQIYSKAANVCIWLGDGKLDGLEDRSSDFDAAMEFCEDILDPENHERYSKDPAKAKSWSNLIDLMRCSWFSRRWIIQKLAFVREATVHCGHKFIHWFDFADAIGIIVLKIDDLRALFERPGFMDEKIAQNYKYVSQMEPLGAKVLVDAISKTIRRSLDDGRFEPTLTLGELVCNLTPFETSDPRDTIFAVLNISREFSGGNDQIPDRHCAAPAVVHKGTR
jgi:hypothetical protein